MNHLPRKQGIKPNMRICAMMSMSVCVHMPMPMAVMSPVCARRIAVLLAVLMFAVFMRVPMPFVAFVVLVRTMLMRVRVFLVVLVPMLMRMMCVVLCMIFMFFVCFGFVLVFCFLAMVGSPAVFMIGFKRKEFRAGNSEDAVFLHVGTTSQIMSPRLHELA